MGSMLPLLNRDGRMEMNLDHRWRRALCGHWRKWLRVLLQPHHKGQSGDGLSLKSHCCCINGSRSFFHFVMKSLLVKEREKMLKLKQSQSTRSKAESSQL